MSEAFGDLQFAFVYGVRREGRQCVRLLEPFTWGDITVPEGFISDFASVPTLFLDGLFPSFDSYAPAAVVHDYLYATGGLYGQYTRKQADDLFLEIMKELGIPWWKRSLMYRAVRLGGGSGWGRG